jgi:hypothetical protein
MTLRYNIYNPNMKMIFVAGLWSVHSILNPTRNEMPILTRSLNDVPLNTMVPSKDQRARIYSSSDNYNKVQEGKFQSKTTTMLEKIISS